MSAVGPLYRTTPCPMALVGWLALVLGAAVGCGPFGQDSAPPDDSDAWLDSPLVQDWSVEISPEVPTVARVTWTSEIAASGTVRFGAPGLLELSAPVTPEGTAHEVLLLGLLPDTDYALQVSVTAGDDGVQSGELAFRTGSWPENPPTLELSSHDPSAAAPGFTILPIQGETGCWTTVLDSMARVVWAHPIPCQSHRARLAPDGSGIVSHTRSLPTEPVVIRHVSFFGEIIDEIEVPDAHHDFTIVGEGSYAVLGYSLRSFEHGGETVDLVGDTIVEVDRQGQTRVVWELFDHLEPDLEALGSESDWAPGAWDWSHCNYLRYVPAEDAYYVTSRNLDAVFEVDRSTGAQLWTLSDAMGDFSTPADSTLVALPHSVEVVEGGLLLFNQTGGGPTAGSGAVEILLDESAGTAERGWSYQSSDGLFVGYLGSAWPMHNGNTLVVFSESGQMDEVTPDGRVVYQANSALGWTLSYAEHVESLYVEMPSR